MEPLEPRIVTVFLLLTLHEVLGQYRHFVFERPEDFRDNGFTCVQHGVAANCVIKQAERAEDLPAYFPSPYLQLPGPLMYVETTVNIDRAHFRLESNARMPGYIVSFRGEYFAHKETSIGCLNSTEDDWHAWPPATPSEDPPSPHWLEGKWLYVTKSRLQKLGFFVYNDRQNSNNLAVFRRLEIVIDEEPNLIVRVDSLEHAAEFGLECVSDDSYQINSSCELKSVKNASELPPYFSDGFRKLALPVDTCLMYVEGAVATHKLLFTLPVQFAPDPVGVLRFNAVYYTETEGGFGYGPILDPDSCDIWISFSRANDSEWITNQSYDLQPIKSMIVGPSSKVGFFAMNDRANKVSVFLRLEIRGWYTQESVIEDPTGLVRLVSAHATEITSELRTSSSCPISSTLAPTGQTDAITGSTDPTITTSTIPIPTPVTSPSESTTSTQETTPATASVSETPTTEESGSSTEFESVPSTTAATTTPGITEPELSTLRTTETSTVRGGCSCPIFKVPSFIFIPVWLIWFRLCSVQ